MLLIFLPKPAPRVLDVHVLFKQHALAFALADSQVVPNIILRAELLQDVRVCTFVNHEALRQGHAVRFRPRAREFNPVIFPL